MKPTPLHTRRPAGFTLLEILVVIAIIMVLAAMTMSGLSYVNEKAKISQTEVFISSVSQALGQYKNDNGDFPPGDGTQGSTEEVYDALYGDSLLNDSDTPGQIYLDTLDPNKKGNAKNVKPSGSSYVLVDAWKMNNSSERQEIYYQYPGEMNPSSDFDIWSVGPDHQGGPNGSESERKDDINNW